MLMKLNLTTLVEEQLSIGVSLFPNPAADALNVEWSLRGSSHFNPHLWRLYDLTGRMAASGTWPSSAQRAQINVSNLPPGAYLQQLLDAGKQTASSRFVKR